MAVFGSGFQQTDGPTTLAVQRLLDETAGKHPRDLASAAELEARRRFLQESMGEDGGAARSFERLIGGDELQPVAYLERGAIAARAVARIAILAPSGAARGAGTGFLIAPGVLLTNHHVLPSPEAARPSLAGFSYEVDLGDRAIGPVNFRLDPDALFHTDPALDFTVVAVAPLAEDGRTGLATYGHLPVLAETGKANEGEWLTIIQHPEGGRKQLCVRDNKLLSRQDNVLWYSTDTKPGSSGSPVFNNDWFVVALHHAGVPALRAGVPQTVDGRDFTPGMPPERQKWIGNEGIRASRIHQALRQALPAHPLLQPLFAATPASARIAAPAAAALPAPAPSNPVGDAAVSASQTVTIPLQVTLTITPSGSHAGQGAASYSLASPSLMGSAQRESMIPAEAAREPEARIEAPFDPDYSKRAGYSDKFLGVGEKIIGLPVLGAQNTQDAAPLLDPTTTNKHVLHYENFSVVMHKRRKLAIYSAANVSFGRRYAMARAEDVWRTDPRIDKAAQLGGWYYARNRNQFDRGHLTRREDLEYGDTPRAALMSAGDTCHWTNCTPQHARFNRNKAIWQGIERYILEESIFDGRLNAQIITGPVLDEGDPEYLGLRYPLQYWKVVAALKPDGALFATAYIASQAEVIAQYGIESTEAPFGAYKTFQTSIANIERLTGLAFTSGAAGKTPLRSHDPMEGRPRRRSRAGGAPESFIVGGQGETYREIAALEDIIV